MVVTWKQLRSPTILVLSAQRPFVPQQSVLYLFLTAQGQSDCGFRLNLFYAKSITWRTANVFIQQVAEESVHGTVISIEQQRTAAAPKRTWFNYYFPKIIRDCSLPVTTPSSLPALVLSRSQSLSFLLRAGRFNNSALIYDEWATTTPMNEWMAEWRYNKAALSHEGGVAAAAAERPGETSSTSNIIELFSTTYCLCPAPVSRLLSEITD